MLFTTPTEWAALGFTLIAGWFFGLASSSGGKKWKRQLEDAELNYASARDRDDAELRAAQDRIRELERELRDARPAPSAAPVVAAAATGAVGATLIERAQEKAEAAPAPPPSNTWIPEGPPPPPLPMSTAEAQPVEPTPAPAPVQEEVAPASPVATFPAAESGAPAAEGGADPAAAGTYDQGEPTGSVTSEWLPPHVRAETAPQH
ncbi:hypothetical protein K9B35_09605 [Sphingomonas sp. R647]|uniref:hypothetical protein n=1 Tax=Sphingomonas sp. R647 TaxID=2875233 RepID=UPI001CD60DD8|nr:hypothetical protein [Sphingomonas sp. R647]MCA1198221.1 hypothetical protein [Sphingomonas sp. R647]